MDGGNDGKGEMLNLEKKLTKILDKYVSNINKEYITGKAVEQSYRFALKQLLENYGGRDILTQEETTNSIGDRPDYTVYKNKNLVGFVETKNIGEKLDPDSPQMKKYDLAMSNVLLTDYLTFILKVDGKITNTVELLKEKDLTKDKLKIKTQVVEDMGVLIDSFLETEYPSIKNSKELAELLAKPSIRISQFANEQLLFDKKQNELLNTPASNIWEFYNGMIYVVGKISDDAICEAFSEIITYGLFLSKLQIGKNTLTRNNITNNIPENLIVIKKLFGDVANNDVEPVIRYNIDHIIQILNSVDLDAIQEEFVNSEPFTHFYETFLNKVDPKRKKTNGVFLTPRPVVEFMTSGLNDILKEKFGKAMGLGDTDITLLDPAIGTGTFFATAIETAISEANKMIKDKQSSLILDHLLKNFMGFDIMITAYVISHIKMQLLLRQLGYKIPKNRHLRIHLTNTLDISSEDRQFFYAALTNELRSATKIKQEERIMVLVGNPPYATRFKPPLRVEWMGEKMLDYKKGLNEKKISILDDEYVKFIRMAQHKIVENGYGVFAFITNNSFLAGSSARVMRKTLLNDFNQIFILNLHGDRRDADGSDVDENVFSIRQGVAISVFVKIKNSDEHSVYYKSLTGSRDKKFEFLRKNNLLNLDYNEITPNLENMYLFVPRQINRIYAKLTF